LRNISVIIPTMLESKEIIVSVEMINTIQNVVNYKTVTKEMVIEQLQGFTKGLSNNETMEGLEYAQFLLEELQREKPKLFIIESLLTPFRKAFVGTEHIAEARDIANNLWRYVKIEQPAERCTKNK
ncbi:MAG TPA: TetR/AcrR family transcriptional regulator, partial [Lysinibacillus sp.]|nr:TetR/AcrR family transcriptional regulator [Lysinibacillus sp.]